MEMNPASDRYAGKIILAPMVKIGTLPTRILALRYGADLVYTEEIVDWKFLRCKRVLNEIRNTVDYIDETDNSVFFQTCEEEKGKVILQIGTCDPERALAVGQLTQNDISGIDINMGCPKQFSLTGGMGAALLNKPDKIEAILTLLVKNLKIPVTCKIRVLPTIEETLTLCKLIESCGVAAIGIHGRTRYERPQHENRNDFLRKVAQALLIPVIANGGSKDIEKYEDIERFRKDTGCSSVMLARAAQYDPSIFSPNKRDFDEIVEDFLHLAMKYDLSFTNTKYTIQRMMRELQETKFGKKFLATRDFPDLCNLWDLSNYYESQLALTRTAEKRLAPHPVASDLEPKKIKLDNRLMSVLISEDGTIIIPNCEYVRGHYSDTEDLPKSKLCNYTRSLKTPMPRYEVSYADKRFLATVNLSSGEAVRTDVWQKSKKAAEQAAAMACLIYLGKWVSIRMNSNDL